MAGAGQGPCAVGEIDRQHVLPDPDPQAGRDAVRQVAAHLYDPSGGLIAQYEFGAGANTVNAVHGATRNPFDTALTVGGEDGGRVTGGVGRQIRAMLARYFQWQIQAGKRFLRTAAAQHAAVAEELERAGEGILAGVGDHVVDGAAGLLAGGAGASCGPSRPPLEPPRNVLLVVVDGGTGVGTTVVDDASSPHEAAKSPRATKSGSARRIRAP